MNTVFFIVELIGIMSFAIAGAIEAINKETDLFGVIFLALTTSFGGGMIRDIILGRVPVFFTSYILVSVCVLTAILVFIIAAKLKNKFLENEAGIERINNVFDALGLGSFAVSGTKIAITLGFDAPFIAIFMGMITCVGGSMIRDFCLREIPLILTKRIYAIAALLGGACYWSMTYFKVNDIASMIISATLVFVVRMLATYYKWNVPKAIDFSKLKKSENTTEGNLNE